MSETAKCLIFFGRIERGFVPGQKSRNGAIIRKKTVKKYKKRTAVGKNGIFVLFSVQEDETALCEQPPSRPDGQDYYQLNLRDMKKIILIAALTLGVAFAAAAQPRAIGGRLGYGLEASYQHTVNNADFVEATLGLFSFASLNATATYNFMIAQPAWTDRGEWGFYAGPGAALGIGFVIVVPYVYNSEVDSKIELV